MANDTLPVHPSQSYLDATRQPNLYAATIIPFVFSLCAVAGRFWCRYVKGAGYGFDDLLIFLALLSLTGLSVDTIWMIPNGLGKHIEALHSSDVEYDFWLGWFIGEVTYTAVIVFVKFSILALYRRIFAKMVSRWELWGMTAIIAMWGIAVFVCEMIQCIPLKKYWERDIPGTCPLNDQNFFFAISIPNIIIDVMLLIMPIRYIGRLNLVRSRKQAVGSVFLLGGFVCVASILRLVSVVTSDLASPDYTWEYTEQCIWADVECNSAVICACLPCLQPVWTFIIPKRWGSSHGKSNPPNSGVHSMKKTRRTEPTAGRGKYFDPMFASKVEPDNDEDYYDEQMRNEDENNANVNGERHIQVLNEWTVESRRSSDGQVSNHRMI